MLVVTDVMVVAPCLAVFGLLSAWCLEKIIVARNSVPWALVVVECQVSDVIQSVTPRSIAVKGG